MRISIIAVGGMRRGPEQALAEDYLQRARGLGRSAGISALDLSQLAESRASTAALRKAEEGRALLAALPQGGRRAVLDGRGEALSSESFAAWLKRQIEAGGDLAFVIGGPDGLDPALLGGAGKVLSLGPMTWPHRLVRVLLAEQIYRAVTIMVNHPYHRP